MFLAQTLSCLEPLSLPRKLTPQPSDIGLALLFLGRNAALYLCQLGAEGEAPLEQIAAQAITAATYPVPPLRPMASGLRVNKPLTYW